MQSAVMVVCAAESWEMGLILRERCSSLRKRFELSTCIQHTRERCGAGRCGLPGRAGRYGLNGAVGWKG